MQITTQMGVAFPGFKKSSDELEPVEMSKKKRGVCEGGGEGWEKKCVNDILRHYIYSNIYKTALWIFPPFRILDVSEIDSAPYYTVPST